jgi:hypothetical protein
MQEWLMPILPPDLSSSFFSDLEVAADMLDFVPPPKAALRGNMPFNKLLGAGMREGLLSRAKWCLPLLGLFILSTKKMVAGNAGADLAKLLESGKISWSGGEIEAIKSFYKIVPIDGLLNVVTTFCAGWNLGFDTKAYWQVLTFFVDYGFIHTIMLIESERSATTMTPAKL